MKSTLYFEFGSDAAKRLDRLTRRFGERSAEATVTRALGLLEAIEPYLHDGVLTVIDPHPTDPDAEPEVELVFERVAESAGSAET